MSELEKNENAISDEELEAVPGGQIVVSAKGLRKKNETASVSEEIVVRKTQPPYQQPLHPIKN